MLLRENIENINNNDEAHLEIEDFKQKLSAFAQERDSLLLLWQISQKTIEALEAELRTYRQYDSSTDRQNFGEVLKDLEIKLETSLTDYIELEKKMKALQNQNKNLQNELKNKESDIVSYKERGKKLEDEICNLNKLLEEFKINLMAEKKNNEDVKKQLDLTQKECLEHIKKESEAKSKVLEALQLFDTVSQQKKEAHKRITKITAELSSAKQALVSIRRDTETACRKETDDVRERYNEKVTDMLTHIRALDQELVEKGMLLNKALRKMKTLEEERDGLLAQHKHRLDSVDPRLAVAEQRQEAMFQELVCSERRNIQLTCEKQCLAIDLQRTLDLHTRECSRRDWEEGLLRAQCEELRVQVEHLQKSLDETHGMISKLQAMLASRAELSQKMASSKEDEVTELNKHLENQIELSRKWKESYIEMSEKMKRRLEEAYRENQELKTKLGLPAHDDASQGS